MSCRLHIALNLTLSTAAHRLGSLKTRIFKLRKMLLKRVSLGNGIDDSESAKVLPAFLQPVSELCLIKIVESAC